MTVKETMYLFWKLSQMGERASMMGKKYLAAHWKVGNESQTILKFKLTFKKG